MTYNSKRDPAGLESSDIPKHIARCVEEHNMSFENVIRAVCDEYKGSMAEQDGQSINLSEETTDELEVAAKAQHWSKEEIIEDMCEKHLSEYTKVPLMHNKPPQRPQR
jgi:hypothetical protein